MAATLAVSAILVIAGEMPGPFNALVFLLALLVLAGAAMFLAGRVFLLFRQRRRRGALSAALALAAPAALSVPMALAAPYLHLWLTLNLGIGYLGPAPDTRQPVGIYDWTTGMAGGPNVFLIHDTTDAIATRAPKGDPSAWRNMDFLKECAARSRHLIGHYYICVD